MSLLAPLAAGVGWICQRLPSHRSASVSVELEGVSENEPTAMQDCFEAHATDDSRRAPLDVRRRA